MELNIKSQLLALLKPGGSPMDQANRFRSIMEKIVATCGEELIEGLKAFIEALLDDNMDLVISRKLLEAVGNHMTKLPDDVTKMLSSFILDEVQPRVVSFEEQVAFIRQNLAKIYEKEERWKEAVNVLLGIPLEMGQTQFSADYKRHIYLKIADLYLEDGNSVQAKGFIKKACLLVEESKEKSPMYYKRPMNVPPPGFSISSSPPVSSQMTPSKQTAPPLSVVELSGEILVETKTAEGKLYYYNSRMGESAWSKPEVKILSQDQIEAMAQAVGASGGLVPTLGISASQSQTKTEVKKELPATSGPPTSTPVPPPFLFHIPLPPPPGPMPPGMIPAMPGMPPPAQTAVPTETSTAVTPETAMDTSQTVAATTLTTTTTTTPAVATTGSSTPAKPPPAVVDGEEIMDMQPSEKNENVEPAKQEEENMEVDASSAEPVTEVSTVKEGTKEEVEEQSQEQRQVDKLHPVSSTLVPGTPWYVVWTGDNRVFFFNPRTRTSVWEKPEELKGCPVVKKLMQQAPQQPDQKGADMDSGYDAIYYTDVFFLPRLFASMKQTKDEQDYFDVIIKAGGRCIPADQIVLCGASPYFRRELGGVTTNRKILVVDEGKPDALATMIDFAYGRKMLLNMETVQSVLDMSTLLEMPLVTDACFDFLIKELKSETVLMIYQWAVKFKNVRGVEAIETYMGQNFEEVSLCKDFFNFPLPVLERLIRKDDLFVVKEEVVFESVMKWVKFKNERESFLPVLLPFVRFALMEREYLHRQVSSEPLIQNDPKCQDILAENLDMLSVQDRFCKEKDHLKCLRLYGSLLFCVVKVGSGLEDKYIVEYFDSSKNWNYLCNVPAMEHENYVVCTTNSLYVITKKLIDCVSLNNLDHTTTENLYKIPSLAAIIFHQSKIYFIGGRDPFSNKVTKFCPHSGLSECAELLLGRAYPVAVSCGSYIYVTGGTVGNMMQGRFEQIDVTFGSSTEIEPMIVPRHRPCCAALNDKLYVCGGTNNIFASIRDAEVFDSLTGHWTFISPVNTISHLVSYSKHLMAFEEPDDINVINVKIYDEENNEWKQYPSANYALTEYKSVMKFSNNASTIFG